MGWKKIGRVQHVSALLCQGLELASVLRRLQSGPKAYQEVEFAQGENWQIIFGKTYNSDETLLPHIQGATPLFETAPNIWMGVGTAFNLPSRAQKDYVEKLREDHGIGGQAFAILPQFLDEAIETHTADIFLIEQRLPVSHLILDIVS